MSRRIDRSAAARQLEEQFPSLRWERDANGDLIPFTALPEQAVAKWDGRWAYFRFDRNMASLEIWSHGEGDGVPSGGPEEYARCRVYSEIRLNIGVFASNADLVRTFGYLISRLTGVHTGGLQIASYLMLQRA